MEQAARDRASVVFTLFDANGNGHVDREDFQILGNRATEAVPDAPDTEKKAVRAALEQWWLALSSELDTDHDGTISHEEFLVGVLSPERVEEAVREYARALSTMADPDDDGFIERSVFVRLMIAIGFAAPNVEVAFDSIRSADSEQVGVREWAVAIEEYFHPDKAGIPGDHLVP